MFKEGEGVLAIPYNKKDGDKVLQQSMRLDTGEEMWTVTAPVFVRAKYWGGFRLGLSTEQTDATIAGLRKTMAGSMVLILLVASGTVLFVVQRLVGHLRR